MANAAGPLAAAGVATPLLKSSGATPTTAVGASIVEAGELALLCTIAGSDEARATAAVVALRSANDPSGRTPSASCAVDVTSAPTSASFQMKSRR